MSGTRGTRGAKGPGVEELRFDFGSGGDQARDSPSRSPSQALPAPRLSSEPPNLSVVADEAGRWSPDRSPTLALSVSDFYNRVRGALREAFPTRSG